MLNQKNSWVVIKLFDWQYLDQAFSCVLLNNLFWRTTPFPAGSDKSTARSPRPTRK